MWPKTYDQNRLPPVAIAIYDGMPGHVHVFISKDDTKVADEIMQKLPRNGFIHRRAMQVSETTFEHDPDDHEPNMTLDPNESA